MKDQKKALEIADKRFQIISPIWSFFDDHAPDLQVRKEVCMQTGA